MTSFVAVLPFIHQGYRDACVATMSPRFRAGLFEVDNTRHNMGIMRAHNLAVQRVREWELDWLIVMSAAIRFGAPGGDDFLDALDDRPDALVIESAGVYGWHLIAFRREVLETVGEWDENFTPYGFDDIDYSIRFQLAYGMDGRSQLWDKEVIDVEDAGMAHSVHLAGVTAHVGGQIDYFMRKWGRHPGASDEPFFDHPFADETKPVSWWPRNWGHL